MKEKKLIIKSDKEKDQSSSFKEPRSSRGGTSIIPQDNVACQGHYTAHKIQPLDYISGLDLANASPGEAFCVGNIIKYVSRYRLKNGMQDLDKAKVYLDRLIAEFAKQG